MGLPSVAVAAGPAAVAEVRAAAVAAAGTAPPSRLAGVADCWGGCILQGSHRDSQRAGLQWNHSLIQVCLGLSFGRKNPSDRYLKSNLR